MPQMAPMSWLMLFTFFSISLMTISAMNYFIWVPTPCRVEKSCIDKKENMTWKW